VERRRGGDPIGAVSYSGAEHLRETDPIGAASDSGAAGIGTGHYRGEEYEFRMGVTTRKRMWLHMGSIWSDATRDCVEDLPSHQPLSSLGQEARNMARSPGGMSRSRRTRSQSHIDIASSTVADMVHNLERQREVVEDTVQNLGPIRKNHTDILRLLDHMKRDIVKHIKQ
jgi:hypothetical protein